MSETGNSKVEVIGRIPRGTHLCQFYHDKDELHETLAPYFEAGLETNDMCIWITAESLGIEEARRVLEQNMPDSQDSVKSGQMQILDASDWFPPSGKFDADKQLSAWKERLGEAKSKGYTGIWAAIDHSWLDSQNREAFSQYESIANEIISQYPMTAICCYPANHCTPSQYIEIFKNHGFLLSRENNEWKLIENQERSRSEKKIRQSEEKYRLIAENVTDVIWTMDMNLNFTYMSPSVFRARGFTAEEAMSISVREYLTPSSYQAAMEVLAEELENEKNPNIDPFRSRTLEVETYHKDGSIIWTEAVMRFLYNDAGDTVGILGVTRNIIERKQVEEKLQLYTNELNEAYNEVFQYAEVVAHDICAPLRAVRFYTHMLRSDIPEGLNSECRSHLDTIDLAVNEGESMARELFVLAGIGKGEMNYQKVDIGALLREQVKLTGMAEKGIAVKMEKKWPIINSEPVLIRQIFINLIGNAIKFNDSSTKKIELGWKLTKDKEYEFFVRDNGIGIPPYKEANIFRVFGKLHPTVEYEGSGMGLAIVKKAAGKLGGSIRFTSEVGKGSTFFVTIPEGKM